MQRIEGERWRALVAAGTELLAALATGRGSISYASFNERVCAGLFDLDDASERRQLGQLLGDISRASVHERGVMLSALVHHQGDPMAVGSGFYALAEELGRLDPSLNLSPATPATPATPETTPEASPGAVTGAVEGAVGGATGSLTGDVRRRVFLGEQLEAVYAAYSVDWVDAADLVEASLEATTTQAATETMPGTWHESDPTTKVAWPVARAAWVQAAAPVLEGVAGTFGAAITYEELAQLLFASTGYRTRMLLGNWIGQVLGPVQGATLSQSKPALSSLVVRAETGGVGEGYINHDHPDGFSSPSERQEAAARDRLACYRAYCDHVPQDAEPQMTALYEAKSARQTPLPPPPVKACSTCFTTLPVSGVCDYCA